MVETCKLTPASRFGDQLVYPSLFSGLVSGYIAYTVLKEMGKDEFEARSVATAKALTYGGVPLIAGILLKNYAKDCSN